MPVIYLSPSTQENNLYVSGGTEEEWMNRLADAMVPYLTASGIQYVRNTPDMTAASSIRASNAGNFDLHLALHSNAAPEGRYGQVRGILCPTTSGPSPPLPSVKCAGCGPLRSFWSWVTMITWTTRPGSKTTWIRWPAVSRSP